MKNLWKNIKDMPNTQNIIVNLDFLKSMFFLENCTYRTPEPKIKGQFW